MKYLRSFFARKSKDDKKINPSDSLSGGSVEDYDGVIREVEYFTTEEINIINEKIECGSLLRPRTLMNNYYRCSLISITFGDSRPYTDNINHHEIRKFKHDQKSIYTLSGYKYDSHFDNVDDICEVINNRLLPSKVYYALGVTPTQWSQYGYEDIEKLIFEYSVIRNNKVNEFRLKEIADELGVDFLYAKSLLKILRVSLE